VWLERVIGGVMKKKLMKKSLKKIEEDIAALRWIVWRIQQEQTESNVRKNLQAMGVRVESREVLQDGSVRLIVSAST
jgi:hypothetical protein